MSVDAIVKDGQLVETASSNSVSSSTSSSSALDKDAFLQLLVAQMKYQDPLEPTSNTEYISQYATFSELEQMQNMSSTLELSRASSYVGQEVIIKTENSAGETEYVQGKVDYVTFENNKAYLYIDGNPYSASDVYATVDSTYSTAVDLATSFETAMDKLPTVDELTTDNEEAVTALKNVYNNMTVYQQSFISEDLVTKLTEYVKKMAELTGTTDDTSEETTEEV